MAWDSLKATMVELDTRSLGSYLLCKLQDTGDKWPHETESSDLRPGSVTLTAGLSCDTQAQGQRTENTGPASKSLLWV